MVKQSPGLQRCNGPNGSALLEFLFNNYCECNHGLICFQYCLETKSLTYQAHSFQHGFMEYNTKYENYKY